MRRSARMALAGIAVVAVMAAQGHAAILNFVDQENLSGVDATTAQVVGSSWGQEFTPTVNQLDAVEFGLRTAGSSSVRVDVYAGAGPGFGGVLLGQSAPTTFNNVAFTFVHFDFASPVALTPGAVHSLQIIVTMGDAVTSQWNDGGNPYAGGRAINTNAAAHSILANDDLVFREGNHSNPIPEPSSLVLWSALGLMGLAGSRRRKRQAA